MSLMTLPYTNLHEINLDWIIEQVKQAKEIADNVYSPENPPPYPVRTVNGQTGDVTIIIPVNSVNGKTGSVVTPFINPGDAIQRIDTQSPNEEAGIQRVLNGSGIITLRVTHNGNTPEAYVRYSIPNGQNQEYRLLTLADIPSSSGVVSVNGMTGVVVVNGANLVISNTDNRTIAFAINAAEDQLADQLDRILGTEDDITTIQKGIAILANGNTHAAVTSGQFVFVKSHPTLTPGVYVATANIATNEALTSSNLSTVPNGGLNALKTNIDTLNSNLTNVDHKNVFTYVVAFNKTLTGQGDWTDGGITFPVMPGDRVTMDVIATGTGQMTRSAVGSSGRAYKNDAVNISNYEHGYRYLVFTVLSGDESITISSYANSAITVRTAAITVISKY